MAANFCKEVNNMEPSQLIFVKCEICQGSGKVKCPYCQKGEALPKEGKNSEDSKVCQEKCDAVCPFCQGSGYVVCPGCCGGGYLDMPALA